MKQQRRIWAVVPVKTFPCAKARLAPVLDAGQRQELARLMLKDVLSGLQKLEELSGIVVVSGDAKAKAIAAAHGAGTIDDAFENGPNAAIALAIPALRDAGADAMIVVPADVPQIEAEELRPILRVLSDGSIALVPAARDGGTNLLGCSPVDILQPCFGPNSFAQHMSAAKRAGIKAHVFSCSSLLLDVDRPQDILDFRAGRQTRTGAYLARVLENHVISGVTACAQ